MVSRSETSGSTALCLRTPHLARSCAPRCLYIQSGGCARARPPAGGAHTQRIGLGRRGAAAAQGLCPGFAMGWAQVCTKSTQRRARETEALRCKEKRGCPCLPCSCPSGVPLSHSIGGSSNNDSSNSTTTNGNNMPDKCLKPRLRSSVDFSHASFHLTLPQQEDQEPLFFMWELEASND